MSNLQLRKGQDLDLPILLEAEPGYSLDAKKLYIGNSDQTNSVFINEEDIDKKIREKSQGELITMRNGYSAEECADGALDILKKEFTPDSNTGEIVIDNGIKHSKILSLEMRGRTINQLIPRLNLATYIKDVE